MQLHVLLGAEYERAGRARLDASRLEAHGDAIGAQRALVGLVILLGDPRYVERAPRDAIAAADAILLVEIHDAVGVLDDRAGRRAGLQTPWIGAVHAAILADEPLQIALRILHLGEAHQRPRACAQIVRVLVSPDVRADLVAQ